MTPWHRPAECDSWEIETEYAYKVPWRKTPIYKATAFGYLYSDSHAIMSPAYGVGREAAEHKAREAVCAAIKEYEAWKARQDKQCSSFTKDEVCPC